MKKCSEKKIEIVVHCYAVNRPWYASLLCYQLSSLVIYKPKCSVTFSICCCSDDKNVNRVLLYFHSLGRLDINVVHTDANEVYKRAINRNLLAKNTEADIVWFCDPDYLFYENSLDTLTSLDWPENAVLIFPETVSEQYSHAIDMRLLKSVLNRPRIIELCSSEIRYNFYTKKFFRAIGSIQIVQGDFARKYGYCPDNKNHQTPTENPFEGRYSTKSDLDYRLKCKRIAKHPDFQQAITLPNIYRMTHPHSKIPPEKAMKKYDW